MFRTSFVLAVPVGLLLCGTSAFALTADQVWADLQGLASGNGGEIKAATEVKGAGSVTLNGVTIGPAGQAPAVTIAAVEIAEQADGSVVVTPEDIKIADTPEGKASVEEQALAVTVREDAGGLGYSVFADMLKVTFDMGGGAAGAEVRTAGSFALAGLAATYGRATDGMTLDLAAGALDYDLIQIDQAAMMNSSSISKTSDVSLKGRLALPEGVNLMALDGPAAFADAVAKGLALDVALAQGASSGSVDDRNPMFPLKATFASAGGTTSISASGDSIRMDAAAPGLSMEITPPGAPMALPVSMSGLEMTYLMPVTAPEGGDYGFVLRLTDLVLDEGIWGMFDPGAALPREPANLALDLSGKAKLDLMGLMLASENGTQPPMPEPLSLDIKELGLKLAGAALSGTGAFSFDNSMLAMGGPPMPVGTANLRLEGGNKLIDGLIATGLLKEEDAMGARMMMAMFGKPEGDDVITSQIESREGGSIFVNGQQIQ